MSTARSSDVDPGWQRRLRVEEYHRMIEAGVFVRPFGSVIYLTPPFTISEEELAKLTAAVVKVAREYAASPP